MKQKISVILSACAALAVAMVLTAGGCVKKETAKEETTNTTKTAVETTEENWVNSIARGDIEEKAISGKINEKSMTVADIQIKKWDSEYSWSFSNQSAGTTCGVIVGNDAVNFSSKILQTGTFTKKMEDEVAFEDYHAYYHYQQDNGTPMSVNVDWSATIVIKNIDQENKKVSGWAKFDFSDNKTAIAGSFEADLCE